VTPPAADVDNLQVQLATLRCPPSGQCEGKRVKVLISRDEAEAMKVLRDQVKCREPDRCVMPEVCYN
jgi:hypothetical protein